MKSESSKQTPDGQHIVKSVLNGFVTDMDKDFILLVESEKIHDPVVFVEKSEVSRKEKILDDQRYNCHHFMNLIAGS